MSRLTSRGYRIVFLSLALAGVVALAGCQGKSASHHPECIAPAKPGGGYDLTCRLLANGLQKTGLLNKPMVVSYMPGGIGAVAYNHVIGTRDDDNDLVVAASTGAAVNLALGKFGSYDAKDVRWLGAFAVDYGVVVVPADSPYHDLKDLVAALKKNPTGVTFGAGGSVGSQDWMKVALLAKKAADVSPKKLHYVSYEGGGEAMASLLGRHIDAFTGDASEMAGHIGSGKIRVLAVLANDRLGGVYKGIPTAKEQGFNVEWPTWRGFYMGPKVSDEAYQQWVTRLKKLVATDQFQQMRRERGLFPEARFGQSFRDYVLGQVKEFQQLADEVGLGRGK